MRIVILGKFWILDGEIKCADESSKGTSTCYFNEYPDDYSQVVSTDSNSPDQDLDFGC
jgi:hypothetical protein